MGTGPGKKLVLVSRCSISICYRGADPQKPKCRQVMKRDMQSVGLIFPLGAAVGSPAVAVYDTLPGSTNPSEEIVVH